MSYERLAFHEFRHLAEVLIAFRSSTASYPPQLPVDSRPQVISLLRQIMSDEHEFENYLNILIYQLKKRKLRIDFLQVPIVEFNYDSIALEGFDCLDDEQLSCIATSPESLISINDFLTDPETEWGPWLFDAYIESQEVDDRFKEIDQQKLKDFMDSQAREQSQEEPDGPSLP